jgi:hypothetical protein
VRHCRQFIQRVANAERGETNAFDAHIDQCTKVARVFERCAAMAQVDQTTIGRREGGGQLLDINCAIER